MNNEKEKLKEKKKEILAEIDKIQNFIKVADPKVFEIMISEIKERIKENVAGENWKAIKAEKKQIEEIRNLIKLISNQSELLEKKEQELDNIEWKLKNTQLELPLNEKD